MTAILALIAVSIISLLVAVTPGPVHCTARGVLPDPKCTPGVTNPAVNQTNIATTICKAGWTSTIRPPVSYTQPLKLKSIREYGYADTNPAHYEYDHLISLQLGGHPADTRNLWAEPDDSPNLKDAVENELKRRVCAGIMTLTDAQQRIAKDWTTALQ